jgi:hypothetical protein
MNRPLSRVAMLLLLEMPTIMAHGVVYDIAQELHRLRPPTGTRACAISPDMRVAAIIIVSPNGENLESGSLRDLGSRRQLAGGRIEIVDLATNESKRIAPEFGECFSPVWSPDGRSLAFFSRKDGVVKIVVWNAADQSCTALSTIGQLSTGIWDAPTWTPNSDSILFCSAAPTIMPLSDRNVVVSHSNPGPPSRPALMQFTLSSIDRKSAAVARIAVLSGEFRWREVSPNGRLVGYLGDSGLCICDLRTGQKTMLATKANGRIGELGPNSCAWSPSSDYIAYVTYPERELWVAATKALSARRLVRSNAKSFDPNTNLHDSITPPVWLALGSRIVVALDGSLFISDPEEPTGIRKITSNEFQILDVIVSKNCRQCVPTDEKSLLVAIRMTDSDEVGYARINIRSGESIILRKGHASDIRRRLGIWSADLSKDGNQVIFVDEQSDAVPDFWIANRDFSIVRKLVNLNPSLPNTLFAKAHLISFWSADGERAMGSLILPLNYVKGTPLPLIVMLTPGISEGSRHLNDFGLAEVGSFNAQLLASRGYAVLKPASPALLEDSARYVLPAIEHLVDVGVVDPAAVGILAGGKGGLDAIQVMENAGIIKAGVISSGPFETLMRPDLFLKGASILALDRMHTPLLLAIGGDDNLQTSQAETVFYCLQRLHREATMVEYVGEKGEPDGWRIDNQIDCSNRMLSWLDDHLGTSSGGRATDEMRGVSLSGGLTK